MSRFALALALALLIGAATAQQPLENGVTVTASTDCNEYEYFTFEVTEPCKDLLIEVAHSEGQPDLYISKAPVLEPTLDHLTWTSYEWGSEALTISHWDPDFHIGTFYIGVLAYCGTDVETGYEGAVYDITASLVDTTLDGESDILGTPVRADVPSGDYLDYHFCVPNDCADINIQFQVNDKGAPLPEVLVSKTEVKPRADDHAWRSDPTDPDRDNSFVISGSNPDFEPGHYFLSVYGRHESAATDFTLLVSADVKGVTCEDEEGDGPHPESIELELGTGTFTDTINCGEYAYAHVEVTGPCQDLNIHLDHLEGADVHLYVSRSPVDQPTAADVTWASIEEGDDTLLINHYDPEFSAPGTYYIAVRSMCQGEKSTSQFTLSASQLDIEQDIFGQTVTDIALDAEDYVYFHFCVADEDTTSVTVNLIGDLDPTTHPDTYAWPELLVSRSLREPLITSYSYKLAQIARRHITVTSLEGESLTGHYFVGVYGWCTPEEHCVGDCGPCSNYDDARVTLEISATLTEDDDDDDDTVGDDDDDNNNGDDDDNNNGDDDDNNTGDDDDADDDDDGQDDVGSAFVFRPISGFAAAAALLAIALM